MKTPKLTTAQSEVLNVFQTYGVPLPDHALVPLAQHAVRVHQSSSGIRTRRRELTDLGLLKRSGTTKTGSGRAAGVYEIA